MKHSGGHVAIIDYGLGNIHSLVKAVDCFTHNWTLTQDLKVLESSQAIILPGVGAFAAGMAGLKARGLVTSLKDFAESGRPMLGICLGAQMLLSEGHEFGVQRGLDIIPGKVVKFSDIGNRVKIPHVGWNKIEQPELTNWDKTILADNKPGDDMYFVHSFILMPEQPEHVFAETNYEGHRFCSAVKKGNVYGCQFHPEKSGEIGLKIINNFVNGLL